MSTTSRRNTREIKITRGKKYPGSKKSEGSLVSFPDTAVIERNWINFPESVIAAYRSWSNHTSVESTFRGDQVKFCVFAHRGAYRIVLRAEMCIGN